MGRTQRELWASQLRLAHRTFSLELRAQLNIARASSQLSCKEGCKHAHTETRYTHTLFRLKRKLIRNPVNA